MCSISSFERIDRQVLLHDDDVRHAAEHGDRHEVLGLVGELLVEALVDRERPGRRDEQRMAVGLGLRREIGADVAAGAGLLLDDDRLAPFRLQLVGGDARQHVVDAAGRERHDELDGLAGKAALRAGRGGSASRAAASTMPGAASRCFMRPSTSGAQA